MGKIFIFIIPVSWFFILLFGEHNNGGESDLITQYTIAPDIDTGVAKACTDCHSALFEEKVKHPFTTENGCDDCHKNNGNEHPQTGVAAFSLKEKLPGLCLACHADIKEKIADSRLIHKALNDKKSCTYCHSPHSSAEKKLVITNRKDLCLSCHNKTITGSSQTLPNIEQQDKNSKVFHPPFQKCSKSCHTPHASDNYRLLNNAYPEEEYAPGKTESFALCFDCHKASLLETATTTAVTNFRNGDRNLHFVHVNKEKGRKCTFCHYPHATTRLHLIRDAAKFGNFEFQLNYKADSTGGSCFPGCHVERKYDRLILNPDSVGNITK